MTRFSYTFSALLVVALLVPTYADIREPGQSWAEYPYYATLLTFITYPPDATSPSFRTAAVSKALRADSETVYTVINNNKPVVYASRHLLNGSDRMRSPSLFRRPGGGFWLIAGNNSGEFAYIFETDNLYTYTNERLLRLNNTGLDVWNPFAVYDDAIDAYRVYWHTDASAATWYETITDLVRIIEVNPIATADVPARLAVGELPSLPSQAGIRQHLSTTVMAQEASAIRITKAEYDYLRLRLTRLHNTGVTPFEIVHADNSEQIDLPTQAILEYNDGTTKPMNVVWNLEDIVAIRGSGKYTVRGTINQQTYAAPLIRYRADPNVFKDPDSDYYYFTGSYPTWAGSSNPNYTAPGYDRIILRRSTSVQGLSGTVKVQGEPASFDAYTGATIPAGPYNAGVEEITIWHQADAGRAFNRYIWAPEIRKINGRWIVLFTSSTDPNGVWNIRPAYLVCRVGGDPFNPDDWTGIHRIQPLSGDPHDFNIFSLDMTYFKANGRDYVTWTHKPGPNSTLVIAECEPDRPWVLKSHVVLLHQPTYAWEWEGIGRREAHRIAEAQAVLVQNGMVYMAFSGATVDHNYSIGMITAREDADLLDPASWTLQRFPSLATVDLPAGQSGPGHNSFSIDANGNPIIVYHARHPQERNGTGNGGLDDPGRHAFVKPVQFNVFGDVIFYMTPEEELNQAFKEVEITVVVN